MEVRISFLARVLGVARGLDGREGRGHGLAALAARGCPDAVDICAVGGVGAALRSFRRARWREARGARRRCRARASLPINPSKIR